MNEIIVDNGPEGQLSEKPAIEQLVELGYEYINGSNLAPTEDGERASFKDVILSKRLEASLMRINPWLSEENLRKIVRELAYPNQTSLVENNQFIHNYLVKHTSVEQDLGKGKKSQTVKVIDFDNIENNDFVVVNQTKYLGAKDPKIIPDIVLYVNGLPLAVIENKSPYVVGPMEEAIKQLKRYSNTRKPEDHEGCEKLFWYNQIMVSASRDKALTGTISSPYAFYLSWHKFYKDPTKHFGRESNHQEILIDVIFKKENFLDLIRNFIVFDKEEGKIIKKLARYHQFRGVNKTIKRLKGGNGKKERGGVIWHTQGSGKSLTMAFLAMKLRRDAELKDYKLVFLTDRTALHNQLTSNFKNVLDETVLEAKNVNHFKELLKLTSSDLVMGMLQKFQERELEDFPLLNDSEKIIVLVDEAHRGHYKAFGAAINTALPFAPKIAFTGTPLMKDDKTQQEFGTYIDTYTIEQAVEDRATLQIIYEGRESKTKVIGESLDKLFDAYFSDYSKEDRDQIVRKYGKEIAVLEAPKRIEIIASDILEHFRTKIQPEGFKAQIVTASRRAAVLYHEALQRLGAPESAVIISGSHNDEEFFTPYTDSAKQVNQIERFKKSMDEDGLSFLIVKDKLLTGFDAPIEQVMYLDRKLRDHTLLQAIARVNRTRGEKKKFGYIVDYYGLSDYLKDALEVFSANDIKGALMPLKDEIPRLEARHAKVISYFKGEDLNNIDVCITLLSDDRTRAEFEVDLKNFLQSINAVLPDKLAAPYIPDMKKLGKINHGARNIYRDEHLNIVDVGEKVRKLINDHIFSEGIDPQIPPTKLFDSNFVDTVQKHKDPKTQAADLEHAIKNHIKHKTEENPEYYEELSKKLKEILDTKHEKWEELVQMLFDLRENMENEKAERAQDMGFSDTEYAFFRTLQAHIHEKFPDKKNDKKLESEIVDATIKLVKMVEEATSIVGFFEKELEQRKMKKKVRHLLDGTSFCDILEDKKLLKSVNDKFMDLAKVRFSK